MADRFDCWHCFLLQQTELWWNVHTMPILRRILTAQMGVPEDSDMLRVVNEEFV